MLGSELTDRHQQACLWHGILAVLALEVAWTQDGCSQQLYSVRLVFNETAKELVPTLEEAGKLSILACLVAFEAITSAFHAWQAVVQGHGVDPASGSLLRWAEYAVTASIMWLIVAVSAGWWVVEVLVPQTAIIFSLQGTGYAISARMYEDGPFAWKPGRKFVETPHSPSLVLWGWAFASFAAVVAPTVLLFWGWALDGDAAGGGPPWFVYALVLAELVLFTSFGVVQLWDLTCGGDYESSERVYIAASLLAKSALSLLLISQTTAFCAFAEQSGRS